MEVLGVNPRGSGAGVERRGAHTSAPCVGDIGHKKVSSLVRVTVGVRPACTKVSGAFE